MPTKLLFLSANLSEVGGIQVYTKNVIRTARFLGAEIVICELSGLGVFQKVGFSLRFLWTAFWNTSGTVYCAHISFAPLCLLAKVFFGRKYVVAIYGIEVGNPSSLETMAFRRADGVVYLFEKTRKDAERVLGNIKLPLFNIPNSVDTERFFPHAKDSQLEKKWETEGKKVIYTLCRLSASERDNKGFEKVLRAFPRVHSQLPNTKYIMAGSGDDLEAMKKLAEELGVQNDVFFPGSLEESEKVNYYNLCDVFVYPSKREGFPAIVLLEALACGKPIVGGNQPGSEPFRDTFGIIVNPDNSEELADAIIAILTEKTQLRFKNSTEIRNAVQREYGEDAYRGHVRSFLDYFGNKKNK